MVGSSYKNFSEIFDINLTNEFGMYDPHVENVWKLRTSKYKNIITCKTFTIERTQRGGVPECFETI
jgi:hypothetical protein